MDSDAMRLTGEEWNWLCRQRQAVAVEYGDLLSVRLVTKAEIAALEQRRAERAGCAA